MKISVLALLLLAGCYSNGQSRYLVIGPYSPDKQATPAQLAASDDATCKSYGAVFGTTDYIQCREHLSDQRLANPQAANAQQAAMLDAPATGAPVAAPAPAPAPTPAQTSTPTERPATSGQMYCYTDGSEKTCTPQQ